MSAHRLLAILILAPAAAFAAGKGEAPATPAATTPPKPAAAAPAPATPPAPKPQPPAPPATSAASGEKAAADRASGEKSTSESDELRREVDAKVEAAKKELREEIRAQAATQSLAQGWQEEWVDEKRKLELITLDGYYRVRPELFHNFDLRRAADPSGYKLFATSPASDREHTMAGVNMRFRVEPTINVSEEVRLRMQIDGLDNVIMGSTPEYAFSRSDRSDFAVLSESQVPPVSGLNAVRDSIALKRVFGEITTPVGVLRFGRMGSQWGLGMVHNDGGCRDCDHGDSVDRLQFVTQPLPGIYVTPMIDFNVEGPTSARFGEMGQPVDLSQSDDAHSYVLAIAKRDTDQQAKAKLENNQAVINGGVHFTYRTQHSDPVSWFRGAFGGEGGDPGTALTYAARNTWLVIPDLWGKYEQKNFRVEVEVAARIGNIGSVAGLHGLSTDLQTPLSIMEFGAVAQGEYRLLDGKLRLRGELGWASGDRAFGMGAAPARGSDPTNPQFTQEGDIDGPQWTCAAGGGCSDPNIRNFAFNRDYRVDLILWRELIGTVTDSIYAKPSVDYELANGLHLEGAMIYSRAVFPESTPAFSSDPGAVNEPSLGVEFDGLVHYETDDGFFAQVRAAILFPLGGLNNRPTSSGQAAAALESATSFRASLGIHF